MNRKVFLAIALMAMVLVFSCAKKEEPENDFRVKPLDGGKILEIIAYTGKKQTVVIPAQLHGLPVAGIGKAAFQKDEIIRVTIPISVTTIGDRAFAENMLTSVNVGSSVDTIGVEAFANNLLVSVNIGGSVTAIGDRAFRGNQITGVNIPGSVITIGDLAFFDNKITTLNISKSVTSIGTEAFSGNPITNLSVASGNAVFTDNNSCLINKNVNQLVLYYGIEKDVTIPEGVTIIAAGAFFAKQITGVIIPNGVITIENRAFLENELTAVTIPNTVTTIGDGAFYENKIASITIGGGVNVGRLSFDDSSFYYAYINYGRRAGTYIFRNGYWARQ
ncbi:hypothetical protein R84B8_03222 [Treponema sp. R8-4-B8]